MRKGSSLLTSIRSAVSYRMLAMYLLSNVGMGRRIVVETAKARRGSRAFATGMLVLLRRHLHDVISLGTFLTLDDLELHVIAFREALVAVALDGAVVDENIGAVF